MAKKKKTKTIAKLKFDLQPVFNKFIRLRDLGHNDYFKCIACGEIKPKEVMNAGHFYAVKGYDSMRFNEENVHGECAHCNAFNESHLIGYAINLKAKIGQERLDKLHKVANNSKKMVHKWDRFELMEMRAYYLAKIKKMQ